ncbi:MAG: Nif3-like dinuclear metal center hexameric protein [Elusimicrobia bacterium RIFOXYA2_FULL_58_8]|nr:MAG: Nif3-like dinuclear metal center hexameric protein [Elusimicrobia bacterium RIFOXYA12_FULL_57_11]OGS13250.1 MAG: Nif3-like dinuclear metal center hexameric protein [Elusimicrobia bacterium RIFOXYA2_FULL_58_8]
MADRDKIVSFADAYLGSKAVKDSSHNGLQAEGRPSVEKIAFGVSASLECIKKAAAWGADMLIVHHGLLWGGAQPFRGPLKRKLELLFESGMSLCAWHLPLDKHPEAGNNARLLKMLGAKNLRPFGAYEGGTIGFSGSFAKPLRLEDIAAALAIKLDAEPLCFRFGPEKIKTAGVVSGGAADLFEQAVEAGLDLYITGEVSEHTQEFARESGANFISAGHYNTEKSGVIALAGVLEKKFGVKTEFIDVPNPA